MEKILRNILTVTASVSILFQALFPLSLAVTPAYAQEVTPTITSTDSPTPTVDATPTPDTLVSVTPTDVTPTPTDTPTPTLEVTVTPSPKDTPTPTPTVITPTDNPTPTPTPDLTAPTSNSSASITTNAPDYNPTDTVVITGNGFTGNKTYTIEIVSTDSPALDFTDSFTTGANGSFSYSYKLDGNYRQNYSVTVKDGNTVIATTTFTDANPSANLDQCANDPAPSPSSDGCDTSASQWVNGNVGASKSVYFEGDSIPYRMIFDNLSLASHTVTIEWDTTKSSKHAIDYLTTFSRTVTTANPCLGVSGCNPATSNTFAIPADPQVTGGGVTPVAGNFTMYGGTITGVSTYSYADGAGFSGDKSARITITFTPSVANPVLAWGGHIATRSDWGAANSAVSISGSPYHTRLIDLDGSGGNQDRSLSADAVIFPGSITVIKDATPNGSTSFSFTGSPSPLTSFSLVDDGTSANTKLFSNITNFQTYTVNETPIPSGWAFDAIQCSVTSDNGGSQTITNTSVAINLKEGENVTCTYTNHQQAGTLIVKKHVVNDNGGSAVASDFTLHVKNSGTDVTNSPAAGSESGTSYSLTQGSYVVSEDAFSGYTQTSISGDCDNNGNVTVVAGQTKTCTITNNDNAPQLHLRKTITNDNGGSAAATDWTLSATGTGGSPTNLSGTTPVDSGSTFKADTYALAESGGPSGYTAGAWDCGAATMPDATHVTVPFGGNVTCTINNDDNAAHLIVIKHVVNDNGGTAVAGDFSTTISGVSTANPTAAGVESPGVDNVLTSVGSYSVDEGAHTGYNKSLSTDCSGTIALGQTKTCTITNDDIAPTLKLHKNVTNDNGGNKTSSDWTLTATGTNGFSDAGDSSTFHTVNANVTYTLSESTISGYTAGTWSCDGGTLSGDQLTLGLHENVTCSITNNDQAAHLIVIKHVINNNGGTKGASDFTMNVTGTNVSDDSFSGAENPGTEVTLNAGSYSVDEGAHTGYTKSLSTDCSGTIANGQTKTCTITNDDIAPQLTVIKYVINNNGGSNVAGDFTMNVTAVNPSDDSFPGAENPGTTITLDAGSYSVAETGPSGYAESDSADCSGTIAVGEHKTCTITNDDIAPQLTVIKHVINDDGGTATAATFTMLVTATNPSSSFFGGDESGTTITLDAGSYSVGEIGVTGYEQTGASTDCSGSIAVGETKTCTITNDDIAPTLTVNKVIVPSSDTGLFNLQIDDTTAGTGANVGDGGTTGSVATTAGAHTVGETAGTNTDLSDYTAVISGDCASDGTITLALAQNATCTITNTRKGSITIVKDAQPNDEQDFAFSGTLGSFTLDDDGGLDNTYQNNKLFSNLTPNSYTVTETEPNQFWTLKSLTCTDIDANAPYTNIITSGTSVTITLTAGKNVSCTFANSKLGPTRTQGFWQTHTAFTSQIFNTFFAGGMQIGITPHKGLITNIQLANQSQLFGAYYASISKTSTGKKRAAIDQARMQLLQQLVTAKLNCAAFGCSSAIQTLVSNANTAYATGTIAQMLSYANQLDAYNNSGDTLAIPYSSWGKATPVTSQNLANIPFWDLP